MMLKAIHLNVSGTMHFLGWDLKEGGCRPSGEPFTSMQTLKPEVLS